MFHRRVDGFAQVGVAGQIKQIFVARFVGQELRTSLDVVGFDGRPFQAAGFDLFGGGIEPIGGVTQENDSSTGIRSSVLVSFEFARRLANKSTVIGEFAF